MIKYMEAQFGDRATRGSKSALQDMRNEANRLEALVKEQKANAPTKEAVEARDSHDETEESVSDPYRCNSYLGRR